MTEMKNLKKMYKGRFFGRREGRLSWRANYVCPAVMSALHPGSLVDVGCAVGIYVKKFLEMGVDACGLEGTDNCLPYLVIPRERIIIHDLRTSLVTRRKFDVALCLEVLEHIAPEYALILVVNLTKLSDKILCSAAPPGQRGHYHQNCRVKDYWYSLFASFGYRPKNDIVEIVKSGLFPVKHRREIRAYYNNLMYFERCI